MLEQVQRAFGAAPDCDLAIMMTGKSLFDVTHVSSCRFPLVMFWLAACSWHLKPFSRGAQLGYRSIGIDMSLVMCPFFEFVVQQIILDTPYNGAIRRCC